MNLADFTTEQLVQVLQLMTSMNVQVNHNWKLNAAAPWECRFYLPGLRADDGVRRVRCATLRMALTTAIAAVDRAAHT